MPITTHSLIAYDFRVAIDKLAMGDILYILVWGGGSGVVGGNGVWIGVISCPSNLYFSPHNLLHMFVGTLFFSLFVAAEESGVVV